MSENDVPNPGDELRRVMIQSLEDIRSRLEQAAPAPRDVHLARRAAKRARALARLAPPDLDALARRTSSAAAAARRFFGRARDADVRRATLDRLQPQLSDRRERLSALIAETGDHATARADPSALCADLATLVREWTSCDASGHLSDIVAAATKTYRKVRRRASKAASGRTAELHRWRTAVVDHEYQCDFLAALAPQMHAQAVDADELRQHLGDINDLDELVRFVEARARDTDEDREALQELQAAAAGARARLLQKARKTAERACSRRPSKWADRLRRYVGRTTATPSRAM